MNRAVAELYAPDIITLATKPDTPRIPFKHEVFEEAVEWLHKEGRYTADMLADPHAHRLVEETYNALNGAIGSSITQEMPEEMTYALRNNAFIFSGFKTHRTLSEVGLELTDEEGSLKPYAKFLEDVKRIDSKYNDTYLYAEYNHAVHTTQMAVKWQDFVRDGDDYNLQYRTAGDERVREAHIALDGVTLPPSDKFWDRYLPPNGWNCRCTVVQVLREDFPLSDSEEAIKRGDENTQSIKQQMFRFNPGKTLEVFPPKHPYYKVAKETKAIIETITAEDIKTRRVAELRKTLPNNLTDAEKDAKAANNYEIEEALGIRIKRAMTIEEADRQSANPRYGTGAQYSVNCATCAPAYALRLMGFNVTAKGRVANSGTLNDKVAAGLSFDLWKNADGTKPTPSLTYNWMLSKGYKTMTAKRYREFFEESCPDEGVYVLTIGWKGGGGHATILQRLADGSLKYIEPQVFDSRQGATRDIAELCECGSTKPIYRRGVLRVDNKIFDTAYLPLFDK